MNKICTSIEQSKKIIELGIDVNTADMYWDYDLQGHEDFTMVMDEQFDDTCIPAWSLAALLDVLPNKLQIALAINDFQGDRKEKYAIGSVEHDKYDCFADNSIDACYKIIKKLHELKLL